MTEIINVDQPAKGLEAPSRGPVAQGRWYGARMEEGNILLFAKTPFELPDEDRQFLLSQRQSTAAYHKNIAYRPTEDRLTGFARRPRQEQERLRSIMQAYSEKSTRVLAELLPQYATAWKLDFASFRPEEEQGRQLRLRARNDLIHLDSFPTRPTRGDRILRVFTNINPSQSRVWLTSETFETLAQRFLGSSGPAELRRYLEADGQGRASRFLLRLARTLQLPVADPSPYDRFMLRLHHFLKENREFQESCPKARWEFPPNSTWLVFTDMVAHAVLAGQFALEQTFIVSRSTLVLPLKAPASILESLAGRPLTGHS